jgi:hypothetical protein
LKKKRRLGAVFFDTTSHQDADSEDVYEISRICDAKRMVAERIWIRTHYQMRHARTIMKTTHLLAAAAAMLMAATVTTHAAETADLAVTGMIRPSACNATLSGGGTVNFGTISAQTLSSTAGTALPEQNVTLTINCDAPTTVGITTSYNRAGTVNAAARAAAATASSASNAPMHYFGLGSSGGRTIGAYTLRFGAAQNAAATADGGAVRTLESGNRTTWTATTTSGTVVNDNTYTTSWGAPNTTTPSAYSTIVQPYVLYTAIAPTSQLPEQTGPVDLDGLLTFSIVYL